MFVCSCFSQIQINHNFRFDSQLFSYVDEYIKYYPTFCVLYPVIVSNITPHFLFCILWLYQILRHMFCFVSCDCSKYYATFCFVLYSVIVSNILQQFLFCILWLYQILCDIFCFVSCDCIKYYATFFVLYHVIVSNIK